jgi:hypothetical protein
MIRSRALTVGTIAGLAVFASSSVAAAHTVKFVTEVDIEGYRETNKVVVGSVGSPFSEPCGNRRLITLWRRTAGADARLGSTRSRGGRWQIAGIAGSGILYVTAKKRKMSVFGGHTHVCRPAVSADFVVG